MATATTRSPGLPNVQTEDLPFVDARKFGARLDGVTDDTDALQAAGTSGESITLSGRAAVVSETVRFYKSVRNGKLISESGTMTNQPMVNWEADANTNHLINERIEGLWLVGNGVCDGLRVRGASGYAITKGVIEQIRIDNVRRGLDVSGDAQNEVFANCFRAIRVNGISGYGVLATAILYNTWDQIEATAVGNGAWAFDITGQGETLRTLTCDGPVRFVGSIGSCVDKLCVEGIYAATPPTTTAIALVGNGLVARRVVLNGVDPAKCSGGIDLFGTDMVLDAPCFDGASMPEYPIYLGADSSGLIANGRVAAGLSTFYKIDLYTSAATLDGWDFIRAGRLTDASTAGLKVVAALPTAAATLRGTVLTVFGGAGVADVTSICRKNAADAYEWAAL